MARSGWRTWAFVALVGLAGLPARSQAGVFSLVLATGSSGSGTPSASHSLSFDNGAGTAVGIAQAPTGDTVSATTAGGNSTFSGLALPVLLNLSDGRAYLASTGAPADPSKVVPGGAGLASAAPAPGAVIPSNADLLTLTGFGSASAGAWNLTASLTAPSGTVLGTTQATVQPGGWWVIGLGPDAAGSGGGTGGSTGGGGTGGTTGGGTGGDGTGGGGTGTGTGGTGTGGTAATPEPSTLALAAIGAVGLGLRRFRKR